MIEIKKDRTPRDVVAQTMDYGYWVRDLGYDDVRDIYARDREAGDFDEAFRAAFELEPPETINDEHQLVIVASALDAASERIVTYAGSFGLPMNVVFFQTFEEEGTQYLTRTWLIDPIEEGPARKPGQAKKQKVPWNGKDWYVSFGEGERRDWEDARRDRAAARELPNLSLEDALQLVHRYAERGSPTGHERSPSLWTAMALASPAGGGEFRAKGLGSRRCMMPTQGGGRYASCETLVYSTRGSGCPGRGRHRLGWSGTLRCGFSRAGLRSEPDRGLRRRRRQHRRDANRQ